MASRSRRWLWVFAAIAVAALAVTWLVRRGFPDDAAAPAPGNAADAPSPAPNPEEVVRRDPQPAAPSEPEPVLGLAGVDLEAVREALPDNLYWELAAPTQDPRLLDDREREKERRNELYGKVLSGTGSEEEIREYYDHRNRMSGDYVRFVDYLLDHYGNDLTDQDLGLLHVARRLNLARLQEIPRRMQEALDRKLEQDAAREAWLADQEAFEAAQREAAEREAAAAAAPETR